MSAVCFRPPNSVRSALFSVFVLVNLVDSWDDPAYQADQNPAVQFGTAKPMRYLLYDINPGEGFNLRRDVYIRLANLIKVLNDVEPWSLVLPPWGNLYHWQSDLADQIRIPWAEYFDLHSLSKVIPVIEFKDYLKVIGEPVIDEVYYMQNYAGWKEWKEKVEIKPCQEKGNYRKENGKWRGTFFYYEDVYAKSFQCLSTMAEASFMKSFLLKNREARSVMFDRAECLIHGSMSEWSREWWLVRRSMRFSKQLRDVADAFRKENLDSTDAADKTQMDDDWTKNKKTEGAALGGPYLAVHLRRKDFLYGHFEDVPNIQNSADQIIAALKKQKLSTVFIATDAPDEEYEKLKQKLGDYKVLKFKPSEEQLQSFRDGGVAIIDQLICSHARHFIGTAQSTFSFRIHEERQILGFRPQHTYNRLCGDEQETCEQPATWPVIW